MLTNNQFKYISYGIMIFIVLILISNIYITKINNNYTSSGLIEGFLNKNDKKKVDSGVSDLISKICDKKHKHEVIAYAKSFNNDIPKLKGVCTMNLMINMENKLNKLNNDNNLFSNDTDIKDIIDTLNIIESNVKYLEQDCGGGMFSSGGSSSGFSFGGGDKDNNKNSWFGGSDSGKKNKKDTNGKKSKGKDKALFGWATNNSSDSDSD